MRVIRMIMVFGASIVLSGCVKLTFAWADLGPNGDPAAPSLFADQSTAGAPSAARAWREDQTSEKQELVRIW
ncbi:MAG: hypothetical protein AAGJ87_10345 [Pseudomonadota bacterium]